MMSIIWERAKIMNRLRFAVGAAAIAALAGSLGCSGLPAATPPNPDAANSVLSHQPYPVSAQAKALHATIPVSDLHADPLLWNRDLVKDNDIGHVDVPRLREGGFALQVFSVVSASPRGANYVRNSMPSGDAMASDSVVSCLKFLNP
jgi:hypothetical protein